MRDLPSSDKALQLSPLFGVSGDIKLFFITLTFENALSISGPAVSESFAMIVFTVFPIGWEGRTAF